MTGKLTATTFGARTVTAMAVGLWVLATPALLAGGSFFEDLSLEKALEKAGQEKKVVFIDFFTTWCGPCKMMDRNTFKDAKLIDWMKKNAVAIKVDCDRNKKVATKYGANSYPTLMFLDAKGEILETAVGFRDAEALLALGERVLKGETGAKGIISALAKADPKDIDARLEYAKELHRLRQFDEALKGYQQLYVDLAKVGPSDERASGVLMLMAQLGQEHMPAVESLRELRKRLGQDLRSSAAVDPQRAMDYGYISSLFRENEKTLALFDDLVKLDNKAALTALEPFVFDQLMKNGRYRELLAYGNLNARIEELFSRYQQLEKAPSNRRNRVDREKQVMLSRLSQYYQVYVGLEKAAEATALANRILSIELPNQPGYLHLLLARAGYLSGKPTQENLGYAQIAYEKTDGRNANAVEIFAFLLFAMGEKDTAIDLIQESLFHFEEGRGRDQLMRSLQQIERM
ncbi:Thioredoxin fold domain-containing protein [Sulfidibacter corallicola]|uniref:Thioredoxin fold domain-containing protein n=1 Tax=Sulfidibacter corallicola TaxID=2818388 RepID=A0A8A4TE79_SULCO|nr:thioredoxin domain-containing protein [Sulfidibacter corallicola]QTD47542.1 thioredoxin fold domain-containing protein [Sulfidibacter corallicola]